jgi:protein-S-isoprenylcysteine O-methyltransferase Ste14
MSTLVIVLRIVSLLVFAAPMMLIVSGRRGEATRRSGQSVGDRAPLVGNLASVAVFLPSLLIFAGSPSSTSLVLAASGLLVAVAGVAIVLRSRGELGAAWSLVPRAGQETALVTTGPYRLVRHPIYLGLSVLGMGEALAFASWPAVVILLVGVFPTFVWRAQAEEKLLTRALGEGYVAYRRRTRMIIPHLL